jgi:hypothetical protein
MFTTECTGCGDASQSEDSYSDCCNEPTTTGFTPASDYDCSGAFDGFQVVSDADPGL